MKGSGKDEEGRAVVESTRGNEESMQSGWEVAMARTVQLFALQTEDFGKASVGVIMYGHGDTEALSGKFQ